MVTLLASAMGEEAHVLHLPVELLDWIAQYLPSSDLCSFRLMCTAVNAATQRVFECECFTDRSFILADRDSLIVLWQISKHERFSRSMKTVRFYLGRLPSPLLDGWRRAGERGEPKTRAQRLEKREYRRNHQRLLKKESKLRQGSDVDWLLDTLSNFQAAGNTPAIVAVGEELQRCGKLTGSRRLSRELGYKECLRMHRDPHGFKTIYIALWGADYLIKTLEMGSLDNPLPLAVLQAPPEESPFRMLRSLRLVISTFALDDEEDDDLAIERRQWELACFIYFIRASPLLEVVSLTAEHTRSDLSLDGVTFTMLHLMDAEDSCLQRLRHLELTAMRIKPDVLTSFVARHRTTLQTLKLSNIQGNEMRLPTKTTEQLIAGAMGGNKLQLQLMDVWTRVPVRI